MEGNPEDKPEEDPSKQQKQPLTYKVRGLLLVIPGRFELPAYRLGGGRSIQLSYGTISNILFYTYR